MVNGRYAIDDEEICAAWQVYYDRKVREAPIITDMVTGERDWLARKQREVRLPGVQKGKTPLVSINKESFASYGNTADDPAAQIGQYVSFAYVTALNDLLASVTHHKYIGGDTLVYWAEGGGESEAGAYSWVSDAKEEDGAKLDAILKSFSEGNQIFVENCNMDIPFYILYLSPNSGRISIRFFHRDSFGNILRNNAEHYANMEIYSSRIEKFPHIPPWMLLSETTFSGSASDAQPLLRGKLLYSIIAGQHYPQTLYNAIIERAKIPHKDKKGKTLPLSRNVAAIIKAILIRNYNEREVTTVALNTETNNKPYTLGRLFSVLEQLQNRAAGGSLNATIRDRYFASACANPASVFPTILKLSMHHAAKLDSAVFYEKLKTELLGKLDTEDPFPQALSLDDQGKFILGYYHQTQDFFPNKDNKTQEEQDND